jgi:methylmalonyl-CoA mutase N-terminal domain/subunit
LFEEICKLRAARRVWATIMKKKYNFVNKKPLAMKIHAQTAGVQLTANDVENNHARITIQAIAAVLGGVQSLHTNSHNEALSLPTEHASNIAINLQNILLEETDLTRYPDPLNGSKLITDLTNELVKKISLIIDQVESLGGAKSAVKLGFQKSEIEKESYLEFMKIEEGSKKIIGVNSGAKLASTSTSQNLYFNLPKNLQDYRSDTKSIENNLSTEVGELKDLLRNKENFMWKLKDLLKKGMTVAEICEILVAEFGRHQSEI